ncbi:MAG: hypothetical protein ACXVHT_06940 [Methanobacterium sp.]
MNGLQIIGIGVLLVIIGTQFSLLGNIGSIIGFIVAIDCRVHNKNSKRRKS